MQFVLISFQVRKWMDQRSLVPFHSQAELWSAGEMSDHDNVRANAQLMCEREEAHEHALLHAGTSSRRHYPSQELPETFQEHLVPVAVAQRAEVEEPAIIAAPVREKIVAVLPSSRPTMGGPTIDWESRSRSLAEMKHRRPSSSPARSVLMGDERRHGCSTEAREVPRSSLVVVGVRRLRPGSVGQTGTIAFEEHTTCVSNANTTSSNTSRLDVSLHEDAQHQTTAGSSPAFAVPAPLEPLEQAQVMRPPPWMHSALREQHAHEPQHALLPPDGLQDGSPRRHQKPRMAVDFSDYVLPDAQIDDGYKFSYKSTPPSSTTISSLEVTLPMPASTFARQSFERPRVRECECESSAPRPSSTDQRALSRALTAACQPSCMLVSSASVPRVDVCLGDHPKQLQHQPHLRQAQDSASSASTAPSAAAAGAAATRRLPVRGVGFAPPPPRPRQLHERLDSTQAKGVEVLRRDMIGMEVVQAELARAHSEPWLRRLGRAAALSSPSSGASLFFLAPSTEGTEGQGAGEGGWTEVGSSAITSATLEAPMVYRRPSHPTPPRLALLQIPQRTQEAPYARSSKEPDATPFDSPAAHESPATAPRTLTRTVEVKDVAKEAANQPRRVAPRPARSREIPHLVYVRPMSAQLCSRTANLPSRLSAVGLQAFFCPEGKTEHVIYAYAPPRPKSAARK